MSGKPITHKAKIVLGKRSSSSSPAAVTSSNGIVSFDRKRTAQRQPKHKKSARPQRDEAKAGERREEKEEEEEEEREEGEEEEGSSSDSDNADITIDVNSKQTNGNKAGGRHSNKRKGSSADSTASSSASTDAGELLSVDFGLFDPLPDDDFTFRMLLAEYVPSHIKLPERPSQSGSRGGAAVFALHDFCALISGQVEVGTTIKADGTAEPLGVITALPLPPLASAPLPLYQLHSYLSSHVPAEHKARFNALFSSKSRNVLLVQSRLLNTPAALIGPLHKAIVDDVHWAATNQPAATAAVDNPWHVDSVLLLGRCQEAGSGVSGGGVQLWVRFEEEYYKRESEWHCQWPVPYRRSSESESAGSLSRTGDAGQQPAEAHIAVLMCLTWEKVKKVVDHIQTMMKYA